MTDLAVIMSVYLNDKLVFVKESVESILNQTFSDFHFYLVFDGPVSQEIEDYFKTLNDERIKLFRITENGGLAGALNYLLEVVLKNPEYNLIARMDSDDISMPGRFEKQYEFLKDNQDISCTGSWFEEIDEDGNILYYRRLPIDHEALRRRYITRAPFAHSSVMFRRSLIETAGFYPENTVLMEDNLLWGNALKQGLKFANIPEYLLKFRIDKNFFKRRSGVRYGWNYIRTRFAINKMLGSGFVSYLFSFCIGVIKMLPPFILKLSHKVFRLIISF
jgi:glycosyltransferase involved in cell wall biosynthesis